MGHGAEKWKSTDYRPAFRSRREFLGMLFLVEERANGKASNEEDENRSGDFSEKEKLESHGGKRKIIKQNHYWKT